MILTIEYDVRRQAAERLQDTGGISADTLREVAEIKRVHEQMNSVGIVERIKREVEAAQQQAFFGSGKTSTILRAFHEEQRRFYELIEQFRQNTAILGGLRRLTKIVRHRGQAGATGKGKTSAGKKSSKSSNSSGGGGSDGGGDGDGPQRTSSKKRRPYKNRSTSSAHPPSIPTGEITSPQLPPPQSPSPLPRQDRGLAAYVSLLGALYVALTAQNEFLGIIVFAIIALCVTGHSDVAKTVLTSKAISALIAHLSAKADDE
jgi:hypothetical protein